MSGVVGGADRWLHVLVPMEVKGLALLALFALGALALRRRSAASRHWVWLLGMTGLLALPFLQAVGPQWVTALPTWATVGVAPAAAPSSHADAPAPAPVASGTSAFSTAAPAPSAPAAGSSASSEAPASLGRPASATSSMSTMATEVPTTSPTDAGGATDGARAPLLGRLPWAAGALGIWMLGALLLLGTLARSLFAARGLVRRSRAFPDGRVKDTAHALASELRIRRDVRLLRGDSHAMPMSWGWLRPVVLLPAGAEAWTGARLEAVLRHELAHVRRADCATQVVAEIALAFHWMNPLAWLAVRRLRVEREYACDDLVLATGARASEYAEELLSLARTLRPEPRTAMAAVAMAGKGNLSPRLRAVLDATRRRSFGRPGALGAGAVAAALVLTLAALTPAPATSRPSAESGQPPANESVAVSTPDPGGVSHGPPAHRAIPSDPSDAVDAAAPQSRTCGMDAEGWKSVSSQSQNGHRRIEWSKPGCEVEVRVEGHIEFNADFTDVSGMDDGALLSIDERDGSTERLVRITPDNEGRPRYEYSVDRNEQSFDASAQAWYRAMLLQLFRRTAFMAHERVAALLRHGGVPAVLRELEALNTNYAFADYAKELLKQADLSDAQALDVVKRARKRVDSNYYLASILEAFAPKHLTSNAMVDEYLAAAGTIDSDYYRSQVLKTALEGRKLTADQVASVLQDASTMKSAYYLSTILGGVAKRYALQPSMRAAYLDAVSSIDSDYYRSQVLEALMSRNDLSDAELAVVLRATSDIKSSTYATAVLKHVASRGLSTGALRSAYLQVASGIDSDYNRAQALTALLEKAKLSDADVAQVVAAAAKIGSDHYKAGVLLDVVHRYPMTGATRQALVDAMNTIGSKYYRGQVAAEILKK